MTYSRNESGMARESVRNGSGLARTRARARRGALETGDRRDGLRLHANLTVGAPDAPAISRPDVADVGMPIEHLDFTPPCDAEDHATPPPATWIAHASRACSCPAPRDLFACDDCRRACIEWQGTRNLICENCGGPLTMWWEPLR